MFLSDCINILESTEIHFHWHCSRAHKYYQKNLEFLQKEDTLKIKAAPPLKETTRFNNTCTIVRALIGEDFTLLPQNQSAKHLVSFKYAKLCVCASCKGFIL